MANIRISAMPLASTLDGDDLLALVRVDGTLFTSQRATLAQLKSFLVAGLAIADVSGLQAALDGKAALSHTHAILDVTGLQAALDARALKAGDTMTGALTLPGDPTNNLHAAPKQYVDTRVLRAGDTMTGALILPAADPTVANEATRKSYVDAADGLRLLKAGDTMTGALTLPGNPASNLQAAPKQYVDTADALRLLKAGDTMTGPLVLPGSPTLALQAATKQYVDDAIANAAEAIAISDTPPVGPQPGNLWWNSATGVLKIYYSDGTNSYWVDATPTGLGLQLSGGVMTGALILPAADPTLSNEATRKAYVDSKDLYETIYNGPAPGGVANLDVNIENYHFITGRILGCLPASGTPALQARLGFGTPTPTFYGSANDYQLKGTFVDSTTDTFVNSATATGISLCTTIGAVVATTPPAIYFEVFNPTFSPAQPMAARIWTQSQSQNGSANIEIRYWGWPINPAVDDIPASRLRLCWSTGVNFHATSTGWINLQGIKKSP